MAYTFGSVTFDSVGSAYKSGCESRDISYSCSRNEGPKIDYNCTHSATITVNKDYEKLINKPQINSVELNGSISLAALGLRGICYDTKANWDACGELVSEEGVIYICSDYSSYDDGNGSVICIPGIRIGDGHSLLSDLPYITDVSGNGTALSGNYDLLTNKPSINSVALTGNRSLADLSLRAIYYDTTVNWNAKRLLISEAGAIYIYSDYRTKTEGETTVYVPGVRIGDGNAYVIDLPFISFSEVDVSEIAEQVTSVLSQSNALVSSEDRQKWDGKARVFLSSVDSEILVFSED